MSPRWPGWARIIINDLFLSGAASQEHTRTHLAGLQVLWAGVRYDPAVDTSHTEPLDCAGTIAARVVG